MGGENWWEAKDGQHAAVSEGKEDSSDDPWWGVPSDDPWKFSGDGKFDDAQWRKFHVAHLPNTTAFNNGKWTGCHFFWPMECE